MKNKFLLSVVAMSIFSFPLFLFGFWWIGEDWTSPKCIVGSILGTLFCFSMGLTGGLIGGNIKLKTKKEKPNDNDTL